MITNQRAKMYNIDTSKTRKLMLYTPNPHFLNYNFSVSMEVNFAYLQMELKNKTFIQTQFNSHRLKVNSRR